ncbi:MAG: SprT-like domain-containing protein, partial [Actinobacteria bacterium]|nr:SprT-like domain-containing protein [Actinomycetota bacterium]
WLLEATEHFRPWFAENEFPLPEQLRISVGFAKRSSQHAIGTCYIAEAAEDGVHQIFIAPTIKDPITVLATVLHELIHAADDGKSKHRGDFARVAKAMGLTGKMTATVPGESLTLALEAIANKLGEYPHGILVPSQGGTGSGKVGGQTTRMILVQADCCGYKARTTRKWLDSLGAPSCPCGTVMQEQTK